MGKNVIVVGGGLSGLAAAIYLARAGRTVTLFEKRRYLGGRALTSLRHGFRFNLGAHTFYRGGAAAAVCRELGIPIRGGTVKPRGAAWYGGVRHRLPAPWLPILLSSLLSLRGKSQLAGALMRIRGVDRKQTEALTLQQWLDANLADEHVRAVLAALIRTVTFSDYADRESAWFALAQMKSAMRGAVYIDEGWQKIVDSLHSAAISSGVNFVSSSRIIGVVHDGSAVQAVEMGGLDLDADRMDTQALAFPTSAPDEDQGARLPADHVILAVDPNTAAELAGPIGTVWGTARPVTAACLDVALRGLPNPRNAFAIGIDEPLYLAAHSSFSQLTPRGGALIHAVRFQRDRRPSDQVIDADSMRRDPGSAADEQALEQALDRAQPGWRDRVIHRRFLPSMTVTNALVKAGASRPSPVTSVRGLCVAGDWVGDEGILADAVFASARAAAMSVLAEP